MKLFVYRDIFSAPMRQKSNALDIRYLSVFGGPRERFELLDFVPREEVELKGLQRMLVVKPPGRGSNL